MKKVLLSFIVCLMMVFVPVVKAETLPEVTDHEKVKIYIFREMDVLIVKQLL